MTVVESTFILLNALYTYLKPFSCKLVSNIPMKLSVDCINKERPVHHFIAVKEVAIQDESESGIVLDFVICRV